MSHHLDTPEAWQNGQLYIDDLYVYTADSGTVLAMDLNSDVTGGLHPDLDESQAQPGFHHEARYEFKVHFDGAEREALTYRVTFGEPDADGTQALQLRVLTDEQAREDGAEGELALSGNTGEVTAGSGVRLFAGRVGDPFYVDLSLLARVNGAVKDGTAVDLSGWDPAQARNSFADTTVETIVLEVSHQDRLLHPGARIGVWCATKLATDSGGWRAINRAGHPMMWPIFWPDDVRFADALSSRHPYELDEERRYVERQLTAVVAANGTSEDPQGYGEAVAEILFPDVLPFIVGTRAVYSYPHHNGRSPAGNAPEAMMSLVSCTAVPSGLGPSTSAHLRRDEFPYVVPMALVARR